MADLMLSRQGGQQKYQWQIQQEGEEKRGLGDC